MHNVLGGAVLGSTVVHILGSHLMISVLHAKQENSVAIEDLQLAINVLDAAKVVATVPSAD
jgi:hypothetical protein